MYVWASDMRALMKLMLSLEEGVYAEKVQDDDLGGIEGCRWKSRWRLYRKPNIAGTMLSKRENLESRGMRRA
jgi:hypothetical protein